VAPSGPVIDSAVTVGLLAHVVVDVPIFGSLRISSSTIEHAVVESAARPEPPEVYSAADRVAACTEMSAEA